MEVIAAVSRWVLPAAIVGILVHGYVARVKVYEVFIEGAEDGIRMAVRLAPYFVAILVAVGMFRASGAFDLLAAALAPVTVRLGIPTEIIPLALVRPLSGSAALGLTAEIMKVHGPDSFVSHLAAVVQGSTDTTFFILTVYFGSAGVRNTRYAVPVGLAGDLAGFAAALLICRALYGG
jgi:spore maturation protein B